MSHRNAIVGLICGGIFAFGGGALIAASHTWDVNEIYSNFDGTIQFIELREPLGGPNEIGVNGHMFTSNTNNFLIPGLPLTPPTSFKFLLFGTPAFRTLPGAPMPDYIIPANFFSTAGDTVSYIPWDALTFGAVPIDGVTSLNRNLTTGPNSPTNYAGVTGFVTAPGPGPPGVPDGKSGPPMTVLALDPAGSSLSVSWDTGTCATATDHQILFGQGSQFPPALGGIYSLSGSVCSIGTVSPFVWNFSPVATDGTGLIWWVINVNDGTTVEGSWSKDSTLAERNGVGPGGASRECGVASKDLTNACGQ